MLQRGDTIGIISPAGPVLPNEDWAGHVQALQSSGFRVKIGANALGQPCGYLSATDQERADDIHKLFADPDVAAIICSKGGYGSIRLLEFIDFDLIGRSPKILVGYSDATTLLLACSSKSSLVTFHGPMLLYNLAGDGPDSNSHRLWDVIMGRVVYPYTIPNVSTSYNVLRAGETQGLLIGGNLSALAHLCGTPYMPDLSGSILFLEDIDEQPYSIDRNITQLRLSGALDGVVAVILGEFVNSGPRDSLKPSFNIHEVFADRLLSLNVPLVHDYSFGHGTHLPTFPVGTRAKFDTRSGTVTLLEMPVA
jgi:muramoyltetrapeptide carboxypeptidase